MSTPKTVLITGASSGIGLAASKLFHSRGWNVSATMRAPSLHTELTTLTDTNRLLISRLDVEDLGSIKDAVKATVDKFGSIEVVLNNSGFGLGGVFENLTRDDIKRQFDVNLFGAMDVAREAIPHLRSSPHTIKGIINVSSGAGFWSLPMFSMYSASKFALEGWTEGLSYEMASLGIFVKSVVPHGGVTSTNFASSSFGTITPLTEELKGVYEGYLQKTQGDYKRMVAKTVLTSEDIAGVIYEAATDGKDMLRYWVGDDSRGFVKARYESKNDEEYMKFMRRFFE